MSLFQLVSQHYPESPGCALKQDANGEIKSIGEANANQQRVKSMVLNRGVKRALVDLPRQSYEYRLRMF